MRLVVPFGNDEVLTESTREQASYREGGWSLRVARQGCYFMGATGGND